MDWFTADDKHFSLIQIKRGVTASTYKVGKVRTVMMLRDLRDPEIRNNPPDIVMARKWITEEETDNIISDLKHWDIVGAVQPDQRGIGSDPFKPFSSMNTRERRLAVSSKVKEKREMCILFSVLNKGKLFAGKKT